MNYWLLTTEYPPEHGGGIGTYCFQTATMLAKFNVNTSIFIADFNIPKTTIENPEKFIRIIRFNPNQSEAIEYLGSATLVAYSFLEIITEFIEIETPPNFIESQEYNGIAYFILQSKLCLNPLLSKTPIIITAHAPSFLYWKFNKVDIFKQPNFWICEMEKFCLKAADKLIFPSQYLKDVLKSEIDLSEQNVSHIPNPFQSEVLDENVITGANKLLIYGKLSPQKGSFKVLEYFENLWENGFQYSLTIIGGQEIVYHPLKKTMGQILKTKYKKFVSNSLLSFHNKIDLTKQNHILSEFDIVIFPSIVENLPYAVIEMMQIGKVVLASKQGGQSEIIDHGKSGFLFDHNIENDFFEKVKTVVSLNLVERKEISNNAIKTIKNKYNYQTVGVEKTKLISQLIDKSFRKDFPFISQPINDKIVFTTSQSLTVIIPYFNLGKYINECVESILNSDYLDLKILLIDDGSTEIFSQLVLKKWEKNPKVKIVTKPNSGLADTRNFGAKIADTEFIAFLDADDKVHPNYYSKAMAILQQYDNVCFVGAWTQYFDLSKKTWPCFNPEAPWFLLHNTINSSALVYKKRAFLMAGFNDTSFKIGLEDYESSISLITNGYRGVAIPEKLFNYRVRKNSMIKGVKINIRREYFDKINLKHSAIYCKFANPIKKLIEENGMPINYDNPTKDNILFEDLPIIGHFVKTMFFKIKRNNQLKTFLLKLKP